MFYNFNPSRSAKAVEHQPLYVSSSEIKPRRIPTGEHVHEVSRCLIAYREFLEKFCYKQNDDYVLYHGTNSIEAVISILREGFLTSVSSKAFKQGIAKLGSGLCTIGDYQHAMLYGDNIFTLQILANPETRVLFANNIADELRSKLELEADVKGCLDVNDLLCKHYHVDIIVASDIQTQRTIDYEVLIQNSRVFVHPNTAKMLESIFEKCLKSLFGGVHINYTEISHQIRSAVNVVLIYQKICEFADVKPIVARHQLRLGIQQANKDNILDYAVYLDMMHHDSFHNILSASEILALMLRANPTNITPIDSRVFLRFNSDLSDLIIKGEITAELGTKSIDRVLQVMFSYLEAVDWSNINPGEYGFSGWLMDILWLPPIIGRNIAEKLVTNFPKRMADLEFSSCQQALELIKELLPIELFIRLDKELSGLKSWPALINKMHV